MRHVLLPALFVAVLCSSSCDQERAIEVSGEILAKAELALAEIEKRENSAVAALEAARALAEASGSERASEAVEQAEGVLDEVRAALPLARTSVESARAAHDRAKAAAEAGGGVWETLLGAVLGLVGASPAIIAGWAKYRRARRDGAAAEGRARAYETAAKSGVSVADRLRTLAASVAEGRVPPQDAEQRAREILAHASDGQRAAGIHSLIQSIRGK